MRRMSTGIFSVSVDVAGGCDGNGDDDDLVSAAGADAMESFLTGAAASSIVLKEMRPVTRYCLRW